MNHQRSCAHFAVATMPVHRQSINRSGRFVADSPDSAGLFLSDAPSRLGHVSPKTYDAPSLSRPGASFTSGVVTPG